MLYRQKRLKINLPIKILSHMSCQGILNPKLHLLWKGDKYIFLSKKTKFSGLCEVILFKVKNKNSVNTSATTPDFGNDRKGKIKCSILAWYIFLHFTDSDWIMQYYTLKYGVHEKT